MSSDRLERKRKSEFDTSDDSADELPPAKVRKTQSKNFSRVLTDKLKNLLNWFTPGSLKSYMLDLVKKFNPSSVSTPNMPTCDSMKTHNVEDEDDDEISVIAVHNGTSDIHSQATAQRHLYHTRSLKHGNERNCPLASTPLSLPIFTNRSLGERAKLLERKHMNGFAYKGDRNSHKSSGIENFSSPITNPCSDIEIMLKGKNLKEGKEEVPPLVRKTKSVIDYYNGSKKDRLKYAEEVVNGTSFFRPKLFQAYTAFEVFRLREKEEYKLLLDKVVKQTIYGPLVSKRKILAPIVQVDLTEEEDKPVTSYHFKKEKLEHVSDFLNKCYKPCALVPIEVKNRESQPRNIYIKKETCHDESKDDMQIPSGSNLPKFIPRQIVPEKTGTFFSKDWIEELKTTIELDKRKHLQLISEQNHKLERYKKRRDARAADDQQKREEYKRAGIIFPEDVEMEEVVLPEITPEMEIIISKALAPGDPSEKFLFDPVLTRADVSTLNGTNWLNDEVINCYLIWIVERSKLDNYPSVYTFNSFFYTALKTGGYSKVKRWTRKVDIFSYDMVLVPLHLGMHWALLVVDNRSKQINYYDSMGITEGHCTKIIQDYLVMEMENKKQIEMDPDTYTTKSVLDIPKQMNGYDCGMFTLKYAEYLSRNAPLTFTQENMPYFRRIMIYELLTRQIL